MDFLGEGGARYADVGARLPRGVLLSGPSGTGKTLLARAMAAEAGVPFFSCSASDFVEMLVGRGGDIRFVAASQVVSSGCLPGHLVLPPPDPSLCLCAGLRSVLPVRLRSLPGCGS